MYLKSSWMISSLLMEVNCVHLEPGIVSVSGIIKVPLVKLKHAECYKTVTLFKKFKTIQSLGFVSYVRWSRSCETFRSQLSTAFTTRIFRESGVFFATLIMYLGPQFFQLTIMPLCIHLSIFCIKVSLLMLFISFIPIQFSPVIYIVTLCC